TRLSLVRRTRLSGRTMIPIYFISHLMRDEAGNCTAPPPSSTAIMNTSRPEEPHKSMATVQTMRGPIDPARLGVTLMHEHIFVLSTEIMMNYPEEWGDEEKRIADAVARMNELHSRGVNSVVDLTVVGLGRYIPRIARIAEQTPLHIIVATGLYTYNDIPFYF